MATQFTDDGLHAFFVGTLDGILKREIREARRKGEKPIPNMASSNVEVDQDGDCKPVLTVVMDSGRKFRIIVAEVTDA